MSFQIEDFRCAASGVRTTSTLFLTNPAKARDTATQNGLLVCQSISDTHALYSDNAASSIPTAFFRKYLSLRYQSSNDSMQKYSMDLPPRGSSPPPQKQSCSSVPGNEFMNLSSISWTSGNGLSDDETLVLADCAIMADKFCLEAKRSTRTKEEKNQAQGVGLGVFVLITYVWGENELIYTCSNIRMLTERALLLPFLGAPSKP